MKAIYMRVSTGKQDNEVQAVDIEAYCKKHRLSLETKTIRFEDVISGAKSKRPQYEAMKRAVEQGQITMVIAYKLDRLGRRAIDLVDDMIWFYRQGVDVIFTSQPQLSLKHDDPFSLTKISIFAELSQMERQHISERTKLGLVKAKERDPSLGKTIDHKKRAQIRKLRKKGYTIREIAETLSCSNSTIKKALG